MIFTPKDQEDNDFFDGPDLPDVQPEEKKPEPSPDSPDYWEEESEWEHLRPAGRWRVRLYAALALIIVIVIGVIYVRFFSPYIKEATQYGYVEHIEYRGDLFKTYEGVLIPYKELHDTTRVYNRDFSFSVANAKEAAKLKRMQVAGLPVRVEYKVYHSSLPWRGDEKVMVTKVDSVDPLTILPPEFAGQTNRQLP